jgi:hypothetical protein
MPNLFCFVQQQMVAIGVPLAAAVEPSPDEPNALKSTVDVNWIVVGVRVPYCT